VVKEGIGLAHQLSGPIEQHHPDVTTIRPVHQEVSVGAVPLIDAARVIADATYEEQLLEWLGLVLLKSPRIEMWDKVDPYLCRYELPEAVESNDSSRYSKESHKLHHFQWRGLNSSGFVAQLLIEMQKHAKQSWFALNIAAFGGASYTLLCLRGSETLVWHIEGGS